MTGDEQRAPSPESGEQESPADMAKAWFNRELEHINQELDSYEHTYNFSQTYEPSHPGPPPAEGPGSLDYSDWEKELLEYQQWPEEQAEILESFPDRIFDLEEQAHRVKVQLDKVAKGNTDLINFYATAERQRREIAKERKGMKFDGSKEAYEQLTDLFKLAGFENTSYTGYRLSGKKGPNGWLVTEQGTIGGYSQHLYFNHEHGSGEGFSSQIRLSKGGPWEHENREISVSFSDKVKKPATAYSGVESDGGMFFLIKDDVVRLQSAKDPGAGERRFTQEDFDKFREILKVLHADMKEASQQSS